MHKFRTALSVVATAAMVLGTMGVAAAAGTTSASSETRGAYIMQLDESLGISPVTPSTPTFTDVISSNPYYGYIEAAYQKGFVNGFTATTFGPNLPLTRAQAAKILVEAYEGGNYTPTATSTSFTDNSSIPTALVGFVAEAQTLGLLKGFPNGSFGPNSDLSTAQNTHLIAQLKSALASAAFKVTASSNDVGVGQIVTLSSTATGSVTYTVTGANASSALVSGSSFVASASGNYTVTGTTASGMTASTTIGVYGTAAALKISAPTSVVANGASQTNVTVSVVDANGNVVADNTDNVTLASSNPYAAGVSSSASASPAGANAAVTLAAVNGVATYTMTSGSVPGSSATLTATDTSETLNATSYTATVTSTSQTATSLSVTPASAYLSVNGSGPSTTVDVQVLDQSGEPMLYGTYPFSISLTGPATFTDGTTGPESYAYNGQGPSVTSEAVVTVDGLQGQTGAISLTASGSGLTSGTGSLTSVISGSATAVQLTAPSSTSFAQGVGNTSGTYTVSTVDAHGYPVTVANEQVLISITDSSGNVATDFTLVDPVSGSPITIQNPLTVAADGGIAVNLSDMPNGFAIEDTSTTSADTGSYTVQVSDNSNNGLAASTASALTLTAGAPAQIAVSGPQYIGAANPTATVTAQVEDAAGNPVSVSGAVITFTSSATSPYTAPTLSVTQADTNSSGAATVTATVPAYVSSLAANVNQYTVSATGTYNGSSLAVTNNGNTLNVDGFSVESTVATGVTIDLTNNGSKYTNASSLAQAADPVTMVVYANDQYGNQVNTNDVIALTFGGTGSFVTGNASTSSAGVPTAPGSAPTTAGLTPTTSYNVTLSAGKATLTFYAYGAGNVTVTGADESTTANVSGTADMSVLAQTTVAAFTLYDQSGNNASTEAVTAGTPETLTLKATDALGNYTYPTSSYAVGLQSTSTTGSFRLATTGADVNTVVLPAGSSGVTVYYLDGTSLSNPGPTFTTTNYVAIGNPSNGSLTLTPSGTVSAWTSSNTNASISTGGVITYTGSGTTTVTAAFAGQTLTFTVNF